MIRIILACVFLLLTGFFAASETALVTVNKIRLRHRAANGARGAIEAQRLLDDPNKMLTTILVGTNLSLVITSVLATDFFIASFGASGALIATLIVPLLVVTGAEIIPKTISYARADVISTLVAIPLTLIYYPLLPLIAVTTAGSHGLLWLLRIPGHERAEPLFTRRDFKLATREAQRAGAVGLTRRKLLSEFLDFSEMNVKETMIPRVAMVCAPHDATMGDVLDLVSQYGHSRIPIFREDIDHIIGMVHIMDLIDLGSEEDAIEGVIRPVRFVPESKGCHELLEELKEQRGHLAIVVDEYGGTAGLVTLEDLIEELVGDIRDEHDLKYILYDETAKGVYIVDGRAEIDDLKDQLGLEVPDGDYETISGFLTTHFGEIPRRGTVLRTEDLRLTVLRSSAHRVERLKVEVLR